MKIRSRKFIKAVFWEYLEIIIVAAGVVIALLTIGLLVWSFLNKMISDLAFATGVLALATAVLAFFTYWSIRSSKIKEKRDRQELLLIEISRWAEESLYVVRKFERGFRDPDLWDEQQTLLQKMAVFETIAPRIEKDLGDICARATNAFRICFGEYGKDDWTNKAKDCDEALFALSKRIAFLRTKEVI